MSEVNVGAVKIASGPKKVGGSLPNKKEILAAIEKETKTPGSPLWKIRETVKNRNPYTLSNGTTSIINDEKSYPEYARKMRTTLVLIDRALTLLGYKRNRYERIGTPIEKQIDWSWVEPRLIKFFKDKGILDKNENVSHVRFGNKGLSALIQALKE